MADAITDPSAASSTIAERLKVLGSLEPSLRTLQEIASKVKEVRARDPHAIARGDVKPLFDQLLVGDRLIVIARTVTTRDYFVWFRDMWELSLAILQQYSLPAPVRRKIEQTAKYWASKQSPRSKRDKSTAIEDRYSNVISLYLEQLETVRGQYAAILEALSKGKPMSEADDLKVKAGPFTLVNTGGFKDDVMHEAATVVEKAAGLLNKKGLGKVCYGDVHISKQIGRSRVLAFYMKDSDELFVRAGIRLNVDSLHTVLHELGHRLHRKFLASKDKELSRLYAKYSVKKMVNQDREELDKSKIPPVGETVTYKGDELAVIGFDFSKRVVKLVNKLNPKQTFSAPLESYGVLIKGEPDVTKVNPLGFVTPYAGKNKEENFAEMVGFYCTDELSAEQVKDLEGILG